LDGEDLLGHDLVVLAEDRRDLARAELLRVAREPRQVIEEHGEHLLLAPQREPRRVLEHLVDDVGGDILLEGSAHLEPLPLLGDEVVHGE
jgi:hypothetical protein